MNQIIAIIAKSLMNYYDEKNPLQRSLDARLACHRLR